MVAGLQWRIWKPCLCLLFPFGLLRHSAAGLAHSVRSAFNEAGEVGRAFSFWPRHVLLCEFFGWKENWAGDGFGICGVAVPRVRPELLESLRRHLGMDLVSSDPARRPPDVLDPFFQNTLSGLCPFLWGTGPYSLGFRIFVLVRHRCLLPVPVRPIECAAEPDQGRVRTPSQVWDLRAFYLVPAIYEQRFVHIEYSTLLPEFDYRNTFLFFPNPDLIASNPFQAKTIGLLQSITLVQGLWILLSLVLKAMDRKEPGHLPLRELGFALGVAVGCIFLMSRWSIWVWEVVPGLPRVQFSTRWLSIYSLVSALLISGGFQTSSSPTWAKTAVRLGYLGVAGVSAAFSMLIVWRSCFLDQKYEELAAAHAYNAPEYNPKSMVDWKQRVMHPKDPPASLLEGSGDVSIERWTSEDRRIVIDARTPSWLKMRLYSVSWVDDAH